MRSQDLSLLSAFMSGGGLFIGGKICSGGKNILKAIEKMAGRKGFNMKTADSADVLTLINVCVEASKQGEKNLGNIIKTEFTAAANERIADQKARYEAIANGTAQMTPQDLSLLAATTRKDGVFIGGKICTGAQKVLKAVERMVGRKSFDLKTADSAATLTLLNLCIEASKQAEKTLENTIKTEFTAAANERIDDQKARYEAIADGTAKMTPQDISLLAAVTRKDGVFIDGKFYRDTKKVLKAVEKMAGRKAFDLKTADSAATLTLLNICVEISRGGDSFNPIRHEIFHGLSEGMKGEAKARFEAMSEDSAELTGEDISLMSFAMQSDGHFLNGRIVRGAEKLMKALTASAKGILKLDNASSGVILSAFNTLLEASLKGETFTNFIGSSRDMLFGSLDAKRDTLTEEGKKILEALEAFDVATLENETILGIADARLSVESGVYLDGKIRTDFADIVNIVTASLKSLSADAAARAKLADDPLESVSQVINLATGAGKADTTVTEFVENGAGVSPDA